MIGMRQVNPAFQDPEGAHHLELLFQRSPSYFEDPCHSGTYASVFSSSDFQHTLYIHLSGLRMTRCLLQLRCFGSILALGSYLRAIPVKQKWKWQTSNDQERRDRARPLVFQSSVHLRSEERKGCGEKRAQDRVSCECRSDVDGICTGVSTLTSPEGQEACRNAYKSRSDS